MAESACVRKSVRRFGPVLGTVLLLLLTNADAGAGAVASIDPGGTITSAAGDPCEAYIVPSEEPQWVLLGPIGSEWWPDPSPRPKFVLDTRRHRIVMLFDQNGFPWTLDLNVEPPVWQRMIASGQAPPLRIWQAIAYDPEGDQVVLIGGQVDYTQSDTVWVLSLTESPRWSILNAPGDGPPAGSNSASVYDPVRGRILVFGGNLNGEPFSNGLWELTLRGPPRWRRLHPGGLEIMGLGGGVFVYDSRRDRFLVHGGWINPFYFSRSTLAYAPSAGDGEWSWLEPSDYLSLPKATGNGVGVYDPLWDRLVIHGGRDRDHFREGIDQLWAFDLDAGVTWSELQTEGSRPSRRAFHAAEYDPVRRRMLIFGGASGATVLRDLWALDFPERHYRVRLQLGNGPHPPPVHPGSGGELTARIFGSECVSAIDLDLASLRLAGAAVSDQHAPRYEDADDDGLTDLLVRFPIDEMSIPSDGVLGLAGLTTDGRPITGEGQVLLHARRTAHRLVAAPAGSVPLDVASLRPIGGGIEMRIRGGTQEPMQIDVFDVTGRRLWSGARQPAGMGEEYVQMTGTAWMSGICFVRVVQGEKVVNRRFAVVR